eukprot:CAMPEP_0182417426 /NCGR_PEP_ID=MMETSP1167-20130531/1911_1 /TAXON_ID=2988 /ORGANISM="Mallomonas Sp, Strain CCMP3275" /LENGTH=436 /DNA_ID=CAMNT_0024591005 /DNA_START=170 /DNA_END=1480 /DNA_ORIENTATION=-
MAAMNGVPYEKKMEVGSRVSTPYGSGIIKSHRPEDNIVVVQPDNWVMADKKPPTFFLQRDNIKLMTSNSPLSYETEMKVGSLVSTPYGNGKIISHRLDDQIVIIEPDTWIMANKKPPTFYLQRDVVKLVPAASDDDISYKIVTERLQKANELRNEGATQFKSKNYDEAKLKYLTSLQCIQGLGDKINNEHRAMVFELTIPCSNNVALCLLKLKKYSEASVYADNSFRLIEALESRFDGKVWATLQQRGMTLVGLLKYKRKSLFLLGKSLLFMDELEDSKLRLKAALALLPESESSSTEAMELKDLLDKATTRLAKQTSKQKAMWSKAFQKNREDGLNEKKRAETAKSSFSATIPGILPTSLFTQNKKTSSGTTKKNTVSKSKSNVSSATGGAITSLSNMWTEPIGFNNSTFFRFGVVGVIGFSAYAAMSIMRSRKA